MAMDVVIGTSRSNEQSIETWFSKLVVRLLSNYEGEQPVVGSREEDEEIKKERKKEREMKTCVGL